MKSQLIFSCIFLIISFTSGEIIKIGECDEDIVGGEYK